MGLGISLLNSLGGEYSFVITTLKLLVAAIVCSATFGRSPDIEFLHSTALHYS